MFPCICAQKQLLCMTASSRALWLLGLYLVKKVFCQAGEGELTAVAQLCVEEAIGDKICQERPGVREMQKEAFEDILDQEFEQMPAYGDILGRLKIAILRDRLQNGNHYVEERLRKIRDMVYKARTAADTIELRKSWSVLLRRPPTRRAWV